MKRLHSAALIFLIALTACTDFTPRVSKEQSQKTLERWLSEYGMADRTLGFDKGQQMKVSITEVYSYGYTKTASFAKLRFEDFKYWENGEIKSFTGKGLLTFNKEGEKWAIQRMAFEGEHDEILKEFFPEQKVEVK